MESMSPFSASNGALYLAKSRIKSKYWPWMSPYTLMGARNRSSMSWLLKISRTWSHSWDTSLAWSKNLLGSGSGCHVVGCSKFSMTKVETPLAAPPLPVAMFAMTFEAWIFRPSSSRVSILTFLTRCVKSFSRLTNTCGETRTSPVAEESVAGVVNRALEAAGAGRPRGGVAGRGPSIVPGTCGPLPGAFAKAGFDRVSTCGLSCPAASADSSSVAPA
mmetsp:Transcript_134866/g.262655  ORF Transcript_134866/g.262655 Transcript_134866/m.262655 type:complete len:218 (-) Transcript_134866:892-1545(-)